MNYLQLFNRKNASTCNKNNIANDAIFIIEENNELKMEATVDSTRTIVRGPVYFEFDGIICH